ncbi:ComEC/Rec2 family competence protein [Novosphingobium album (ex Liu et al. 2023)]|uniref:ComEC/Rec2 family competence protein n=1 Tax=Novosphingobium album (ex Liu et al. 2023) TaxID=3031130 RepID=A0ABT5WWE5_9SPHN|nr:ComEC/Rec2 family competence protein [Novosphingobium album (ex Liu et al. 2023)]MDE8654187.1 ComEC/Rec2 family competence protein [Novosphingobium album (ex Liu et al. 2023)]
MSRVLAAIEQFLGSAGFARAPWLAVAFGGGIAAWFALPTAWDWTAFLALCLGIALAAWALLPVDGAWPFLRRALVVVPLIAGAGCVTIWAKSALTGAPPIARPQVAMIAARVLVREEQPARERVRLVVATRDPATGRAIRARINLPQASDAPMIAPGARIRLKARLMPPAQPMLPGAYDFARTAWFSGLAATGSAIGPVEVLDAGDGGGRLAAFRAWLGNHVRAQLGGAEGGIAAAFASGDRGGIPESDAQAMRDSGLAHLLSISGLHVSAVIGAAYLLALRLLALFPWLALRVRLPILAAAAGALAGIGYTVLTGAEVPTVRSCVGALLVLLALALGREALSLRMLAAAAFIVLLFWPESIVGPSFQLSFTAVLAIIALSGAAPVRRFLAPREEGWAARLTRHLAMLLLTGVVIEIALMPIGLYHFHRAGAYGALANVIAIPLTTLVVMPLEALALLLDLGGAGAPAWWLAGKALTVLLGLAHWVASRPGAVTVMPGMSGGSFALFIAGGLWLALWSGRVRLLGLIPAAIGALSLATLRPPDIFVSGDGRHVGITGVAEGELLVLRESRSDFVRENMTEMAGMDGTVRQLSTWPGARCNRDFCSVSLPRGGREWHLLIALGQDAVPERSLAAACALADIVIADRRLPRSCRPRWLKADRALLARTGGLAIDLADGEIATVARTQGQHGWWREGR